MEGGVTAFLPGLLLMLFCVGVAEARQMCWSCQFVLNGRGQECVSTPANWTGGEIRLKCPFKCVIMAEYDSVTGEPTFFHRGCGRSNGEGKDGCSDNGSRHSCFFSCGDGRNYCNDKPLPRSPILEAREGKSSAPSALRPGEVTRTVWRVVVAMATYVMVVMAL